MANYNERIVTGARWLRAKMVTVMNEFGKMPSIAFGEEEVMQLQDSEEVIKLTLPGHERPNLIENFENPMEEFPLLHPDTDEVLGSARYYEIKVILYSLYRHVAEKRDTATPPAVTPVYQPPGDDEAFFEEITIPTPPAA